MVNGNFGESPKKEESINEGEKGDRISLRLRILIEKLVFDGIIIVFSFVIIINFKYINLLLKIECIAGELKTVR